MLDRYENIRGCPICDDCTNCNKNFVLLELISKMIFKQDGKWGKSDVGKEMYNKIYPTYKRSKEFVENEPLYSKYRIVIENICPSNYGKIFSCVDTNGGKLERFLSNNMNGVSYVRDGDKLSMKGCYKGHFVDIYLPYSIFEKELILDG